MQYFRITGETFSDVKPDGAKVKEYLSKANLVKVADVLVDVDKIIRHRWSCQPQLCKTISTSEFHGTCCDGGGILPPVGEANVRLFIPYIREYLSEKKATLLDEGKVLLRRHHMNEVDDECIFLSKDEKGYFCAFHRFAEKREYESFSVNSY